MSQPNSQQPVPESNPDNWLMSRMTALFGYNHAENGRTNRAADRKAHGLTDMQDMPWNATSNTTNNAGGSNLGWVLGPVLGVAMAAAGAFGVLALTKNSQPQAPITTTQPVQPNWPPATLPGQVYEEREINADGTPGKPTGRRLRNANGKIEFLQPDGSWK